MPNVRLIKHEVVAGCGSFEVRVGGRRSRFFYWDDLPSRRLRSEQMLREQALELAMALARGLDNDPLMAPQQLRMKRPRPAGTEVAPLMRGLRRNGGSFRRMPEVIERRKT